tara:strand:+ start:21570 stop:22382 length:813 start_codon:yes stop_codon:yes gene_type:complete
VIFNTLLTKHLCWINTAVLDCWCSNYIAGSKEAIVVFTEIFIREKRNRVLETELKLLHRKLLAICTIAESLLAESVHNVINPNQNRISEMTRQQNVLSGMANQLESKCISVLTLEQPLLTDLRRITSMIKIGNELEQVANSSIELAASSYDWTDYRGSTILLKIEAMACLVIGMLNRSIDSYVRVDESLGKSVVSQVVDVRKYYSQIHDYLISPEVDSQFASCYLTYVIQHLASVTDHATRIASYSVFVASGQPLRPPRVLGYRLLEEAA